MNFLNSLLKLIKCLKDVEMCTQIYLSKSILAHSHHSFCLHKDPVIESDLATGTICKLASFIAFRIWLPERIWKHKTRKLL